VADYIFVLFVVTLSLFWYVLLLHLSLLIYMHYPIHVALTTFIRLLHYFVMFLLGICAVLAAPASLQLSAVIDCCCTASSCLCGYWLYTYGTSQHPLKMMQAYGGKT
jgi:hypothetical protein